MALTPKQEKFCQCVVSGMSYVDSYREAYDTDSDKAAYIESSKLMARDDIQERVKALLKPIEQSTITTVISERDKKRKIIWERIDYCIASGNDNAVARYMDILNKMDSEYLNININKDDTTGVLDTLDTETLKALATTTADNTDTK
jgi:hypothetical protein